MSSTFCDLCIDRIDRNIDVVMATNHHVNICITCCDVTICLQIILSQIGNWECSYLQMPHNGHQTSTTTANAKSCEHYQSEIRQQATPTEFTYTRKTSIQHLHQIVVDSPATWPERKCLCGLLDDQRRAAILRSTGRRTNATPVEPGLLGDSAQSAGSGCPQTVPGSQVGGNTARKVFLSGGDQLSVRLGNQGGCA